MNLRYKNHLIECLTAKSVHSQHRGKKFKGSKGPEAITYKGKPVIAGWELDQQIPYQARKTGGKLRRRYRDNSGVILGGCEMFQHPHEINKP